MPNFSGKWTLTEQAQGIAAETWTGLNLNRLYTWGDSDAWGELGLGDTVTQSSPVQVGTLTTWSQVSVANVHTAALKTDGTLWTWGRASYGKLGHSNLINLSSPVQVGALTNWAQVSAGTQMTAAVKTDGTLWTWGSNNVGELGLNTTTVGPPPGRPSSPVQVGTLTNWAQVSAGVLSAAAVKTDGTLWAWGSNYFGNLGQNNTIYRSSPVQVGALTTWSQVSINYGGRHVAAIKNDGTLWTWGWGSQGRLGLNNQISRSSPVQVGALSTWSKVSAGYNFTAAIKNDGALWTWGRGSTGRLGHNNTIDRSSPVQVGGLTTWSQVAAGYAHASAIKTDGTLWIWGSGATGRLGLNNTITVSSPVQVGTLTTWSQVSVGGNSSAAITNKTT